MTSILLKFSIDLENYQDRFHRHHGPLFHRWLPNGEQDALNLETKSSDIKLKVWFERRGFVEDGSIRYDLKRREVDPQIMATQAVLEGGRLMGLVEYHNITNEELTTLKENKVGDVAYVKLGTKIIKIISIPLVEFLQLLRIRFGQYWINELEKWNSTEESIGQYCRFWFLRWSSDEGKTWSDFVPDKKQRAVDVYLDATGDFLSYLTENDWKSLPELLKNKDGFSLAEITLNRTHQYLDQGDLRHAIIEGATAVELAIPEFFRLRLGNNERLQKEMGGFWNSSASTQLIAIGSAIGISQKNIENTIDVIKLRHKIVHEGLTPDKNDERKVRTLLRTVAFLFGEPKFRFPKSNHGNAIMPLGEWEKEYKKLEK